MFCGEESKNNYEVRTMNYELFGNEDLYLVQGIVFGQVVGYEIEFGAGVWVKGWNGEPVISKLVIVGLAIAKVEQVSLFPKMNFIIEGVFSKQRNFGFKSMRKMVLESDPKLFSVF